MSVAVADPPPPANDRLARFRAIRAKLDPTGDPALGTFYVDSPHSVSARLATELEIAPGSSHLLVGGVGSGKSTELLALKFRLEHVSGLSDTAAFYIDVSKRHDIAKMVPGAVVAQVGLALAEPVSRLEPKHRAVQAAHDVAHGSWEYPDLEYQPPVKYSVPGILVPEPVHENIHRARLPLEGLLEVIRRQVQHVIVMLDGLDRIADIQAFEQLVVQDVKTLSSLGVGTVLVGPLRVLYGIDRVLAEHFNKTHYQPWIDVTANPSNREFLVSVLQRRAGEVLDEPGIDALVDASGGVLRDLLSLAQSALVEAYMGGSDSVGSHEVDDAVDAFGRKHLQGLRPAELAVLQRVRTQGEFVQTSEDDLALLMTRRVLEYRCRSQPRYVVHPTIAYLLEVLERK